MRVKGAEAVLTRAGIIGMPALVKERKAKKYRNAQLDVALRRRRTRTEARLLHRAKFAGVPCPTVLEAGEFSLTISRISGKRPPENEANCRKAGALLAKLHGADIAHGDYTPANLILSKGNELYVIDFGLGYFSRDVEDKAIDVYTMLKSLRSELARGAFLRGYRFYEKHGPVMARLKDIEKRTRYAF